MYKAILFVTGRTVSRLINTAGQYAGIAIGLMGRFSGLGFMGAPVFFAVTAHNRLTALFPGLPGWAGTEETFTPILIVKHPL